MMEDQPMTDAKNDSDSEPRLHTLHVNGINMRIAEQGTGPLVLFCHGWPEHPWRRMFQQQKQLSP